MSLRARLFLVATLAVAGALLLASARTPGAVGADLDGLGAVLEARPDLRRLYEPRGFAPIWGPGSGGEWRAGIVLAALAGAAAHGLDPGRYDLDQGRARAAGAAEREVALTDAFLRYATEVRGGRITPHAAETDWDIPGEPFDALAALASGLQSPRTLQRLLQELPPPASGYVRLQDALRRLRAQEAAGGWPVLGAGEPLRPGDRDARVADLRRRLAASGDLAPSRARPASVSYDGGLERAVRRFQTRHGLQADGVVGPVTVAALNVPPAERARQVEWNLERWRWLPRDLGRRYIVVKVAAAALEAVEDGQTVLTSRVVVGEPRFPTPGLRASVEAVVLNPPWSVPASIATGEILPGLREDRWYLADNEIIVLEQRDDDPFGLGIDWSTVSPDPFPFRFRQRPGPANPLGRVKLDMPNRFQVHLHDTPARALFARPVRTASHGCVRVERARDLAAWLLARPAASAPEWRRAHLDAAIDTGATRRIAVPDPVAVYLLYWTAFVDGRGVLHFRDDVYGRDARLAATLAGVPPPARAAPGPGRGGCPPETGSRG